MLMLMLHMQFKLVLMLIRSVKYLRCLDSFAMGGCTNSIMIAIFARAPATAVPTAKNLRCIKVFEDSSPLTAFRLVVFTIKKRAPLGLVLD